MTFAEYVGVLRAGPLGGAGAALPRRRLQGAAPDGARGGQDRGADRPHRVARRAGPAGRLQPARRVGAAAQPGRPMPAAAVAADRAAARSPRNARAFRVLVRNALFRRVELAALRRYDELGELDARGRLGRRRAGPRRMDAVLRRARRARHRRRRPRPGAADRSTRRPEPLGACARSSTTRPATTTGASPPRSTWPRPTRSARRSFASPRSANCRCRGIAWACYQ